MAGVFGVGILCAFLGEKCIQNAALVVAGNWMASHLVSLAGLLPWAWFLSIDAVSGALLALWMTRTEALIDTLGLCLLALLYGVQCAVHVEAALLPVDPAAYWIVLVLLALAQVVALAVWLAGVKATGRVA